MSTATQVRPVNVGTQVFAGHGALGFAFDRDRHGFAKLLADTDGLPEITDGRAASVRKRNLFERGKAVEKLTQFVHAPILPHGNVLSMPIGNLPGGTHAGQFCPMSDKDLKRIKEIRKRRLRQAMNEDFDGKQVLIAEKLKREPSYISRILNDYRGIEEGLAREFEALLGKPKYWLDSDDRAFTEKRKDKPEDRDVFTPYETRTINALRIMQAFPDTGSMEVWDAMLRSVEEKALALSPSERAQLKVVKLAEWEISDSSPVRAHSRSKKKKNPKEDK